ncbi:MAG: hypothetical protein LBD23_11015 [Oscillospiraceae bacterium]|jgi:hypothetical protein|nr:hypothetical protein [Oscillospiraceae bacterium]
MKKRIFTLALVVLFALTLLPLSATAATVSGSLEKVALPAIDPASGANNNEDTQMGWATEGFEDEDTAMDVEASVAHRAVYLALEMPAMPGFIQFILQTPMGWWQQIDYTEDDLADFWDGSVLRLPFIGDWDPDDIRAKFLLGYYDDGILDLGITDQWLEVYAEVNEGDLVSMRLPAVGAAANNNDENQMGWGTQGFEDEGLSPADIDVAVQLLVRATHLVLEMPEAPGFMQIIPQTPAGWWQQVDYDGDALAGFWDDGASTLSLPIEADWDPTDLRAKLQIAYYDDGVMDLGITGVWLLMGPEVVLGDAPEARELPPEGSLPFDLGVGDTIWDDKVNQLGWNGDSRAIDGKAPFDGGGLTAGMLAEANWFVIYVDNAPDDEVAEMLQLTIFGNANGWSWEGGTMEAPTVQIYDTFVPGAIVFPLGGHPYVEAINIAGDDEHPNRNFGICFQYGGGLENLGITGVWLYTDLPEVSDPEPPAPEPIPDPDPDPEPPPPAPEPEPAGEGFPWWGWALIAVGVAAIVVVVIVVVKKKK